MIVPLLLLVLGLGLAAAAATVGVAAAAVSQAELTRWVTYKLRGTTAAALVLQDPARVLATANAVTTLGVLLAGVAIPALLARVTATTLSVLSVTTIVPGVVIAAYLLPRVLGRRWPERIVASFLSWIETAGLVLAPFIPRHEASARETLAAVLTSDSSILAASDEIEVVSGVLAFSDRPVAELMTPRTSIVAIPEGMLAAEAAHVFMQSGYSRYPVYRGTLDEVIGVTHAFDLLHVAPDAPVRLRPVLTVPGTRRAADLMLEMQRGGGHMAIVLDEFGGTEGLVTFEDLLRDLVSEVLEGPGGPAPEVAMPEVVALVELDGAAPASALGEAVGMGPLPGGAQTVGGLLLQALGRIPRAGERFQLAGVEFDVLAASATRVERVVVRRGPVRTTVLDRPEDASGA
jgi:CBS domain containing-hemolysin-like protein